MERSGSNIHASTKTHAGKGGRPGTWSVAWDKMPRLLWCGLRRASGGAWKATTNAGACLAGVGLARRTASSLRATVPSPTGASGDHHFTQGDRRGALHGRQNCTGPTGRRLRPESSHGVKDSRRCSMAKNSGWQLLYNLGLFIIIILRVYVNRLLDAHKLNVT
jgi:hypothetical protein